MSLVQKLKSVQRDGGFVVLTYDAGDNTEITKRVSAEEFDRQLSLQKRFALTQSYAIDEIEDDGLAVVEQLFEVKKELLDEMNARFDLVNSNYASLKDFMSTVQMQRDKFHKNLQQEASANLQVVTDVMSEASKVQEVALAQISDKEVLLKTIISDIEERKSWTWEEARKIHNEVDRSNRELGAFKVSVEEKFDVLFGRAQDALASITVRLRDIESKQSKYIDEKNVETTKLLQEYRVGLADKTEFLAKAEENEYKQVYLDNELFRRTEVEQVKTKVVIEGVADLQKRVKVQSQRLAAKIEKQSDYLEKVYTEAEGGVGGFSDESLVFIKELAEFRSSVADEIDSIQADVTSYQRKTIQVNKIFRHFIDILEDTPETLSRLLKKMESVSGEWDERFAFLVDHLEQGSLVRDVFNDEDVEEVVADEDEAPESIEKKSWWGKMWS